MLDLAILVARTKLYFQEESYKFPKGYEAEKPLIDRIALQGRAMSVAVCTDNERIDEDVKLFAQALAQDDELLGERLARLSSLLKELGY